MSGLSGFIADKSMSSQSAKKIGTAMRDVLRHRGPDGDGLWVGETNKNLLVMGYSRLAVLDLSEQGQQPMTSQNERYVVVFNGEIYNYVSLREELSVRGVQFKGRSDTEVLVAAIEVWGLNMTLQRLKGMFAMIVWDTETQEIHFARDPFGEKPLFVGWAGKNLIFASELKSFQHFPDFKPQISPQGFADYIHYGHSQAPVSIYEGILSIPAGFRLSLDISGGLEKTELEKRLRSYWNIKEKVTEIVSVGNMTTSYSLACDTTEQLLRRSLSRRMVSDVPIGVLINDTPESILMTAMTQELSVRAIDTFSIKFEDGYTSSHIKDVTQYLCTRHHEISVGANDILKSIHNIPQSFDEPFDDMGAICFGILAKQARKKVTIALSAGGADEFFGGHDHYIKKSISWYKSTFSKSASALDIKHSQKGYIEDITTIINADMAKSYNALNAEIEIPNSLNRQEKMMYLNMSSCIPNALLTKIDRVSMTYGLEIRTPYVEQDLFDLVWRLPVRFKVKKKLTKPILRTLEQKYIPQKLFNGPSDSYQPPLGTWLRGDLKEWAVNHLENLDNGLFNAEKIKEMWEDHQTQKSDNSHMLWRILMFQAWQEKHFKP